MKKVTISAVIADAIDDDWTIYPSYTNMWEIMLKSKSSQAKINLVTKLIVLINSDTYFVETVTKGHEYFAPQLLVNNLCLAIDKYHAQNNKARIEGACQLLCTKQEGGDFLQLENPLPNMQDLLAKKIKSMQY